MIAFLKGLFGRGRSDVRLSKGQLVQPKLIVPKVVSRPVLADIDSRLVRACLGDRAKATRLIDYELKRDSGISRRVAADRALERLVDDRR